jgi:hypothetical protein
LAVCCYNLYVVHAVERFQGCEGFSYFHCLVTALSVIGCRKATILCFSPLKKLAGALKQDATRVLTLAYRDRGTR